MSKIMTTSEFIKQHGLRSTEDLMTSYAEYYHSAKMQEVGEDVERAINEKYPYIESDGFTKGSTRLHNEHQDRCRDAAKFGYNLHKSVDWDKLHQDFVIWHVNKLNEKDVFISTQDYFDWFKSKLTQKSKTNNGI